MAVDADLLLGDPSLSIREGVIMPWTNQGKRLFNYYERLLEGLAERPRVLARHARGRRCPRTSQEAVLRGNNFEVRVRWKNRYGREMSYSRASRA